MMRTPTSRRGRFSVLQKEVCAHAFRRLVGIGQGRFAKLLKSVREGSEGPPADFRFIPKEKSRVPSENRQIVHGFLQELYDTISEPMPEAQEGGSGVARHLSFRKRRGKKPRLSSRQNQLKKEEKHALRLLPPGTFTDYLDLLRSRHPHRKLSLKLLSNAAWLRCGVFYELCGCPVLGSISWAGFL